MTLHQFKNEISTLALAQANIGAFLLNWIPIINEDPEITYPALLMVPPKDITSYSERRKGDARTYRCMFYLFRKNESVSNSDLTDNEKITAWSEIQTDLEALLESFPNNKLIQVGDAVMEFDDGKIGIDDLVWVKMNVDIKAWKPC